MNAKLISVTMGFNPEGEISKSAEDVIVYCARVSSPQNQENMETAPRLLRYLIEHKHWSPFEMASMCVEIETSRAIAAQILRHRSFSFQEFSQRYSEATEFETYEARRQDNKNRQNSIADLPADVCDWFEAAQQDVRVASRRLYSEALARGIAKEQARFLLPLSTRTKLYMNGSVRSWIHYLETRTTQSTQKEHREIAEAIKVIFTKEFPHTAEALQWK